MKRARIFSAVALAMIVGAAIFLATHHRRLHLGKPGLRVVAQPVYGFDEMAPTNAPFIIGSNTIAFPERVLDYQSRGELISKITVKTLPEDTTFARRLYYRTNQFPILCQTVLMGTDRTSIHKPQFCLKGMGLQIVSSEPVHIPIQRPHRYDLPVMRLNVRGETRDRDGNPQPIGGVFLYWFVADGELTASHWDRMKWMARDMVLTGVLQRWAYVICYTPCLVGNEDVAFDYLKEFMGAAVPEFQLTAGSPIPVSRTAAD